MQDRVWAFYKNHLFRYLFVGGSTFSIDLFLLVFLHSTCHVSLLISASFSYWISILYNFTMNRYWTFERSENNRLIRHLFLYSLLLIANYTFTICFIEVASHFKVHYAIAKVMAVIIQTSWTYFAYREIVFAD